MLNPELTDARQRDRLVERVRRESFRWVLRGILFAVMAAVSFSRPGSFWLVLGGMFAVLAVLSGHLSRQSARSADELETKLRMIEEAGTAEKGTHGPTDAPTHKLGK